MINMLRSNMDINNVIRNVRYIFTYAIDGKLD